MEYTKESLQNTWGVVESKEHAEFIIELAELHGFKVWVPSDGLVRITHFIVVDGELMMHAHDCQRIIGCYKLKQITIPLPPKAKDWPQVGDEVLTCLKRMVRVIALDEGKAWVRYCDESAGYNSIDVNMLSKPKTEQELKIEELQTKLCNLNAVDNYILASEIVMGNVEGLSYE